MYNVDRYCILYIMHILYIYGKVKVKIMFLPMQVLGEFMDSHFGNCKL